MTAHRKGGEVRWHAYDPKASTRRGYAARDDEDEARAAAGDEFIVVAEVLDDGTTERGGRRGEVAQLMTHMQRLEANTTVKTITREPRTAVFFAAAIRPTDGEFVAAAGPKPRAVDAARNAWTRERAQWAAVFLSAPRGRSERHGPSPATQLPRGTWAHRVSPNYGQRIAGSAS
ncbi:MAG: hypothetical protein ABSF68_17380, partial [Candidatus Acidiferrales bacterium]